MKNDSDIRKHLLQIDPQLAKIIALVDLPEIVSTHNVFHDLMSCIIEQQIHYRSTKKYFTKLLEKANLAILTIEQFEHFEKTALQDVKLSMRKYETIVRIVDFFQNSKVDWSTLSDIEVKGLLSEIKGVGEWTINMLLLYTLQRPDILPLNDYHLKQLMTKLYSIRPEQKLKAEMRALAAPWTPYRSYAVRYLLEWKKATQS